MITSTEYVATLVELKLNPPGRRVELPARHCKANALLVLAQCQKVALDTVLSLPVLTSILKQVVFLIF